MKNDLTIKTVLQEVQKLNDRVNQLMTNQQHLSNNIEQILNNQKAITEDLQRVLQNAKDWGDLYGEMNMLRPAEEKPAVTMKDIHNMFQEIRLIEQEAQDLAEQFNEYVNFGGTYFVREIAKKYGFKQNFDEATPDQYESILEDLTDARDKVWDNNQEYRKTHGLPYYEDTLEKQRKAIFGGE